MRRFLWINKPKARESRSAKSRKQLVVSGWNGTIFGVEADDARSARGGMGRSSGWNRTILGAERDKRRRSSGWNGTILGVEADASPPFINSIKKSL